MRLFSSYQSEWAYQNTYVPKFKPWQKETTSNDFVCIKNLIPEVNVSFIAKEDFKFPWPLIWIKFEKVFPVTQKKVCVYITYKIYKHRYNIHVCVHKHIHVDTPVSSFND